MSHGTTATAAMAVTLLAAVAHADPTAGQKCEAGKNVAAGKYAVCLHKAQSTFVSNGETDTAGRDVAVLRCGIKYRNKWQSLEDVAAGECPSTGDESDVKDFLDACVTSTEITLRGTPASDLSCGNGIVDTVTGEVCDDGNTANGDGCAADCSSWECPANPAGCDDGDPCTADACVSGGPTCFVASGNPVSPVPPSTCSYRSPSTLQIDVGTGTVQMAMELVGGGCLAGQCGTRDGALPGWQRTSMSATISLVMSGTGALAGLGPRTVTIPAAVVVDTAPLASGDNQSLDTEIIALQAQLPPGDPDFALLRLTAGSVFGFPTPGHTTLTKHNVGPVGWDVDGFFELACQIDYSGQPSGYLGGYSGSTTQTIRLATGNGGPGCTNTPVCP
jgi:cysteine-rich repeat protein